MCSVWWKTSSLQQTNEPTAHLKTKTNTIIMHRVDDWAQPGSSEVEKHVTSSLLPETPHSANTGSKETLHHKTTSAHVCTSGFTEDEEERRGWEERGEAGVGQTGTRDGHAHTVLVDLWETLSLSGRFQFALRWQWKGVRRRRTTQKVNMRNHLRGQTGRPSLGSNGVSMLKRWSCRLSDPVSRVKSWWFVSLDTWKMV